MVTRKEANRKAHRESPGAIRAMQRYHKDVVVPKRRLTRMWIREHSEEVEKCRQKM